MKGLFNLDGFDNLTDDTILESTLTEGGDGCEDGKCNDDDSEKEMKESGNGEIPENPSAHLKNERSIPVPGGDKEPPSNSGHEHSISIPQGTEISQETYNKALSSLKKSFHEACEIIEMLESCTIVSATTDELQMEYTENAILESIEGGPLFERVNRSDKDEVKQIVHDLRSDVIRELKSKKYKAYKPSFFVRMLLHCNFWTMRLWQVLGAVLIEDGNADELCKALTKKYADQLGNFKILPVKVAPSILDLFRGRLNYKNTYDVFFLLIDRNMDKSLKEASKDEVAGVSNAEGASSQNSNSESGDKE